MDTCRFTETAGNALLKAIAEAEGREVLAVGKLDENGLVSQITVAARGSSDAVPALLPYMQKGDVVIHNHPSGGTEPSPADLHVASGLGNQGIGFYITNNTLDVTYVVAEAVQAVQKIVIDSEHAASILLPGGALSKTFDDYEPRDSQVSMLEAVVDGFNEDTIVVVEAGTGVGKSLAYLIPAFLWVDANEERVVVSTATINLQQQLMENDIPLVRRITGSKAKVHLAKGRGNYLCLRRLSEALEENILFAEEDETLEAIRKWAESTSTGGREDLAVFATDELWGRVCSEADSCLGLRCRYREDCFVLKARREAASAQILVVNHHLLFSDQSIRAAGAGYDFAAVLPPFQKIIFDEAHNLERSATSFFSESLSRYTVHRALSRLYRTRRGKPAGLVLSLRSLTDRKETLAAIPEMISKALEQVSALDVAGRDPRGAAVSRFSGEMTSAWAAAVIEDFLSLANRLSPIELALHSIIDDYRDEDEPEAVIAAKTSLRRIEQISLFCHAFAEYAEHPERVFWVERRKTSAGEQYSVFNTAPVHIADIMRETVLSHYDTIVCTSATLSVRDDFAYWFRTVGLDENVDRRIDSFNLPSPFPFAENVLLAVPADAPAPTEAEYSDFASSLIRDAIETSEGGALVLFTSYKMMSEFYDRLKNDFSGMGINALRQGTDDRLKLLQAFTRDHGSVLFATDSFWEGVDTPGESLRLLIICRLPFQVPSDPILEARYELILKRNGNPFFELSLPAAITKLKQGFGRLMRRSTDRGVVLILDSRILKKQYGSAFIESLPETKRCFSSTGAILENIERMLYG